MRTSFFTVALACLVAGLVTAYAILHQPPRQAIPSLTPSIAESIPKNETAYDRVVRTRTLRCGYGSWEPGASKDPNTGEMHGLYPELLEEMARIVKIKIEWTEEIDWGQIPEALQSRKIDAFCAGMSDDGGRGLFIGYSEPLTYMSFDVIVRADDTRFPTGRPLTVADLNKPEFTNTYSEGDLLETVKETEYPAVKGLPLPTLATPADQLLNIIAHKSDFVVFPRVMIEGYQKSNPDNAHALRLLQMQTPLRVYGNVIGVDIHERELLSFLNAGFGELLNSPSYDRILAPYEKDYPGAFLKPKRQYDLPQ